MTAPLIVGGGLAGGAAAALLASAGARPLVLERESAPRHKICGEFLSGEAQAHLAALGLDLAPLGGVPIDRVRLASGAGSVESALPFTALGLTRLTLDEALLRHAERLGAKVERGLAVRSLEAGRVVTSAGDVAAPTVLLASGKHDVRGARRETAGAIGGLIGFKSHFRLSPAQAAALSGSVELVLFEGGYAGLQMVEGGVANLCLLVRAERYDAVGKTWPALLAALLREPHLERRLGDAVCVFERPVTIYDVPYGFLHRAGPADLPGVFRLGDQAAVIPSFSGDGMAMALHSGRLAARMIDAGPAAYHARLHADLRRQVGLATWLQRATEAWPGPIVSALRFAPGLMRLAAAWTRVPPAALRREGVAAA